MRSSQNGFTLVELAIVLVVMGFLLAMGVPAYKSLTQSYTLKGGAENLAAQMRLTRERAISTGQAIQFGCNPGYGGGDYHIHDGGRILAWKLPNGISFTGSLPHVTFGKDGRSSGSAVIVLRNQRGDRDTVSVLLSGMVTNF